MSNNLVVDFADTLMSLREWNKADGDETTFRELFRAITDVMLERAMPMDLIDREIRISTDEEIMCASANVLAFLNEWVNNLSKRYG